MEIPQTAEKRNPFAALIGVSSLLAALLYVAGFAYRWSYYYNFGVQHLVFKLGFQSFLIAAFELVRTPRHLGMVLLWVAVPVLVLNLAMAGLTAAAGSAFGWLRAVGRVAAGLGWPSSLLADILRAGVILYATYNVASVIGYESFLAHARLGPQHPLPAVTAVFSGGKDSPLTALACGAQPDPKAPVAFIGDGQRLQDLQRFFRTCGADGQVSWRLLYRDDNEIYLFAARPADSDATAVRPLTLVLPNHGNVALVME